MSDLVIFAIGVVIFALTVYGTVVTGGLVLTRREVAENSDVRDRVISMGRSRRGSEG